MGLGELERLVMEVLWNSPNESFSVRDVAKHFPDHAYTTIMTVLVRLARKGFVDESKAERTNLYRASASREVYLSSLMTETLSTARDRSAVLTSFARSISASDLALLRKVLRKPKSR